MLSCNDDRVAIPIKLRERVLEILHSAHQGSSHMESRAQVLLHWHGIGHDIKRTRIECLSCCKNAPSQSAIPASQSDIPTTPFESICADFFDVSHYHYLVLGDRLSGWVEVYSSQSGSKNSGSQGLISHLRSLFATFGVPETLSSDGGPEFVASPTADFLKRWGVSHRISSSYFPQSNGRAEVAVKKVKRFLLSCIGLAGSLNNDKFLRGMLQLRNTPDPGCSISPAQILFGRPLRDAFSFVNRVVKFHNPDINPLWRKTWEAKEAALRTRFVKSVENLNAHSYPLPKLGIGDHVFVQNQTGPHPNKWDRSGLVVEAKDHGQYLIKMNGTGRLTLRNRRFLRLYMLPDSAYQQPGTSHIMPDK